MAVQSRPGPDSRYNSAAPHSCVIDPTAYVAPGSVVIGDVTLHEESSVWYNAVLRGDMAPIEVGRQTNIQDLTVIHVDEGFPCTIGSRVGIGHRAILHGCMVEDECLIGMGSILLNGVRIGTGSVIGAGAVVTEGMEVPPGSLVLGVPARVVRPVDDSLKARIDANWLHYVKLAQYHRAGRWVRHGDHG